MAKVFADPKFASASKKAKLLEKRKRDAEDGKPKRPHTAYQAYVSENMKKIKSDNPELPAKEIMGKIGSLWKVLDEREKKMYEEKAKAAKEIYATELETFENNKASKSARGEETSGNSAAAESSGNDSDDSSNEKKKKKKEKKKHKKEKKEKKDKR
eukprot:CAMPEP_0114359422 /NCGR_PEP_ID=MMETSP0101-20121206/23002_1 /TAXON_ID=38822 ORGANISM="Pteridomonas danica, Strain PT" /NCGR_SAMPLE_ID=MMETSP0101 /ASSEMBLY_ACC=CAM_ASM_000211 /LENGTH=155 /DNA_ID=CAMNT_0001502951 /DNA_START=65 /DNA_END=532 /DNA_ORIENTATION=+